MTGHAGRDDGHDGGSAVAEFALVAGLLALLFAAVLQLAVVQHVRSTAIDCAATGALFGARLGSTPAAGAQRTRDLLAASLSPAYAADVRAGVVAVDGVSEVEVVVRAPLPVLALTGPPRSLEVRGHALLQRVPA